MYATTVSGSQLELRIDPAFYNPSHLMDVGNIMRFPVERLDALRDNSARMSYGVLKPRFKNNSPYRMVRIQDFRDPFLDVDSAVGINQSQFAEFHRSECKAGDILIAIAGYVGRAAIVPECLLKLNINQHIARFRPSSTCNVDPYYLISYLISSIGRRQLCRYVSGSVQTGINLEDLRDLLIPQPDQLVQKYIGDKVRQAEQLRNFERLIEREMDRFLQLPDWNGERAGILKSYRVKTSDLGAERLDSPHYDPAHIHLGTVLRGKGAKPLGSLCEYVNDRWHRKEPGFFYLEIGNLDVTTGRIASSRLSVCDAPSRAQRRIQPWDILVSTVRPNRKNIAIVPEVTDNLPIVASTGFSVL
jgi:type I restriction enzyme S subunit